MVTGVVCEAAGTVGVTIMVSTCADASGVSPQGIVTVIVVVQTLPPDVIVDTMVDTVCDGLWIAGVVPLTSGVSGSSLQGIVIVVVQVLPPDVFVTV